MVKLNLWATGALVILLNMSENGTASEENPFSSPRSQSGSYDYIPLGQRLPDFPSQGESYNKTRLFEEKEKINNWISTVPNKKEGYFSYSQPVGNFSEDPVPYNQFGISPFSEHLFFSQENNSNRTPLFKKRETGSPPSTFNPKKHMKPDHDQFEISFNLSFPKVPQGNSLTGSNPPLYPDPSFSLFPSSQVSQENSQKSHEKRGALYDDRNLLLKTPTQESNPNNSPIFYYAQRLKTPTQESNHNSPVFYNAQRY
jgi:hypothetical protein